MFLLSKLQFVQNSFLKLFYFGNKYESNAIPNFCCFKYRQKQVYSCSCVSHIVLRWNIFLCCALSRGTYFVCFINIAESFVLEYPYKCFLFFLVLIHRNLTIISFFFSGFHPKEKRTNTPFHSMPLALNR